ncbi:MAG TPA: helix-turn-helix domain-containing protein [Candidatus Bathyarchaeia archaeon]|nr:helix-turn-helix domain-containing protein [Candidatus Bathyarchaeia archaeon]
MNLQHLGNRIRARREKLGLKQQDVANSLGISPQAVSKWERGENAPDITVLEPLARLLGVSADWLLSAQETRRDVFDAAVLVSSIRGAHEKALSLHPREFALWANGIFYQLTEITLGREGVPIKYMGDQYLCFFAGSRKEERAFDVAAQARAILGKDIRIGLSTGEIYLGSVGHPDYARPDIMGEVVNIAFLTLEWADRKTRTGVGATETFVQALPVAVRQKLALGKQEKVRFRGVTEQVCVKELELSP